MRRHYHASPLRGRSAEQIAVGNVSKILYRVLLRDANQIAIHFRIVPS